MIGPPAGQLPLSVWGPGISSFLPLSSPHTLDTCVQAQGLAQVRGDGPRREGAAGFQRSENTQEGGLVSAGQLEAEPGPEGRVSIVGKGTFRDRLGTGGLLGSTLEVRHLMIRTKYLRFPLPESLPSGSGNETPPSLDFPSLTLCPRQPQPQPNAAYCASCLLWAHPGCLLSPPATQSLPSLYFPLLCPPLFPYSPLHLLLPLLPPPSSICPTSSLARSRA